MLNIPEYLNPKTVYQKRYRTLKRHKLLSDFGEVCQICFYNDLYQNKLEFHHLRPTGLKGEGRGSDKRLSDISNNKDCYILVCRECHEKIHKFRGEEI